MTQVIPPQQACKPDYWDEAVNYLMKRDRILRKIIPDHDGVWLASNKTPFVTLARAIVGQQVSVNTAEVTWKKFIALCGSRPAPAKVLEYDVEQLRAAGLAKRKSEYILDLAMHFNEKKVHPAKWSKMSDEEIVDELCSIRGIGRWTAEMFLIFNLHRPDVLPLDDPRLLKAISIHYFSGEPVSRYEAREVAQTWQPWRTVATWYLWRSQESVAE
ncbi:MAG: DNA-3-methyladenine glycosylase 2 family protein [Advenella sp.]